MADKDIPLPVIIGIVALVVVLIGWALMRGLAPREHIISIPHEGQELRAAQQQAASKR